MAWSKQTLTLPPTAPSVRQARDWVGEVLTGIGRPELADSARLSVSELVTNALLHALPPMSVHVRGTTDHPRVEVADQSLLPPQPRTRPVEIDPDDDLTWSTVGRGLDLVAAYSVAWGADIDPQGAGKVVWFEPSPELREEPASGAVFDLEAAIAELGEAEQPVALRPLALLGFPVELFSHLRVHFSELGRELRLLALTNPGRYPLAVRFAETFLRVEHERRQVLGLGSLDRALATGIDALDLHYSIPASASTTMGEIAAMLDEVYDSFADETLLVMQPAPELLALQHWYLGEFVRQGRGEQPSRWTGPTALRL